MLATREKQAYKHKQGKASRKAGREANREVNR
jgi:hypothetical protein